MAELSCLHLETLLPDTKSFKSYSDPYSQEEKKNQGSLKPTDPVFMTSKYPRGATSQFVPLEKFSLNFSDSSFVICVNLLHP